MFRVAKSVYGCGSSGTNLLTDPIEEEEEKEEEEEEEKRLHLRITSRSKTHILENNSTFSKYMHGDKNVTKKDTNFRRWFL
jgi:hypothetical protein